MVHISLPQGVSTGQCTMQVHILHVRSSIGIEVDGKNQDEEREIADFHDCDTLQTILLAIIWLDLLKGHPAFFRYFRCHSPLVRFVNKLLSLQPDCVPATGDFVQNTQPVYHLKTSWLLLD